MCSGWDISYYEGISFGNMVWYSKKEDGDVKEKIYLGIAAFAVIDYYALFEDPVRINGDRNDIGELDKINIISYKPIIDKLEEIDFYRSKGDKEHKSLCCVAFLIAHEFGHILDSIINRNIKCINEDELINYPELDIEKVEQSYEDCDKEWNDSVLIKLGKLRKAAEYKYFEDDYFGREFRVEIEEEINHVDMLYRQYRHEHIPDKIAINILNTFDSLELLTK